MKKEEKTQTQLQSSGSIDQEKEKDASLSKSSPQISEEDLKTSKLFEQILDATMLDKLLEDSFEENNFVVSSKDGSPLWLLSLTTKSIKRVQNNAQITMIDQIDENISHCLILNDLFEVKNELIKDIGWN